MKKKSSKKRTKGFGTYFIELLIIIVGISISFMLNEWREERIIEQQKNQLILDIKNDLAADSTFLDIMLKGYSKMLRSHDSLLLHLTDSIEGDSLTLYLEHFTQFLPFNKRTRSFDILSNNKELKIQAQDTSIRMFMNLHNYVYKTLQESLSIDKDFVLNVAAPYSNKHSPYIIHDASKNQYKGNAFYDLRKKDEFLNLLEDGYYNKLLVYDVLNEGVKYIKSTKTLINKKVDKLQSKVE